MEVMEQMMMQIWLGNLKVKLEAGDVEEVIGELTVALTRIEEDRAPAPDAPPSKE